MAERRFLTAAREADTVVPGLVLEDDGTVWVVNPDGTREQVSGGGGAGLPSQWTVDEGGNVTIAPVPVDNSGDFSAALAIDVSAGPGKAAIQTSGSINVDMEPGVFQGCYLATVSGADSQGSAFYATAPGGTDAPYLPDIKLTDPSSPGEARFAYGAPSFISSSFDPASGQAVMLVRLGSGSYSGDIFHCRDGSGALIFQIKSDGEVHLKTGASVVADL